MVSKVLADNRNLTEIYEKGYREFSKLVAEGLTNEWSKLGIFSFFDGPYIDNQEYYLGPNQALLAIAEHSNQSDTAKIFILDSLQPGRLELCDKSGFELFLEKFEEVFPNSEKFYFGPRTSDRTWLHEFQTLKIPFDWIIKRPNVFAEVLTDASPIGEEIGPGDAGFEDFSSMHEVLVSKLGPPSLTEEVLGRIRDGNTSEVAGEAAGLMASLVNPATAVSRGVRYLGRFMTILMDRRKQEVKEVYEEWRNRVKETFKEENLKKFFDEKQEEQKQIIDTIRDGKNVLLILETRETLYDLFYPLVIQHLVEEILPEKSTFQKGIYWIDVERDLKYLPKQFSQQKVSLLQFLLPYFRPHISAIFDWRDPAPFFKRYFDFVKKVIGIVFDQFRAS